MSERKIPPYLSQHSSPKKTKTASSSSPGWFVEKRYKTEYGLNFLQASLYTAIVNLSRTNGYCYAGTKVLVADLDMGKTWIKEQLLHLEDRKLIWRHSFYDDGKKQRHIVTREDPWKYWNYLKKTKQWKLAQRFEEDFLDHLHKPFPPDLEGRKRCPAETSTVNISCKKVAEKKHRPPPDLTQSKSRQPPQVRPPHGPSSILLNILKETTKTNNPPREETPKKGSQIMIQNSPKTPKRADAPSPDENVVFFEIRRGLEGRFSAEEVGQGIEWYQKLPPDKTKKIRNVGGYISSALTGGYAVEELAAMNAQLEKQYEQDKIKTDAQSTRSKNKKLALQTIFAFKHCKGWRHHMGEDIFSLKNDRVEHVKAPGIGRGLHFVLPDGTERHGIHRFLLPFTTPHNEFKQALKEFIASMLWVGLKSTKETYTAYLKSLYGSLPSCYEENVEFNDLGAHVKELSYRPPKRDTG